MKNRYFLSLIHFAIQPGMSYTFIIDYQTENDFTFVSVKMLILNDKLTHSEKSATAFSRDFSPSSKNDETTFPRIGEVSYIIRKVHRSEVG